MNADDIDLSKTIKSILDRRIRTLERADFLKDKLIGECSKLLNHQKTRLKIVRSRVLDWLSSKPVSSSHAKTKIVRKSLTTNNSRLNSSMCLRDSSLSKATRPAATNKNSRNNSFIGNSLTFSGQISRNSSVASSRVKFSIGTNLLGAHDDSCSKMKSSQISQKSYKSSNISMIKETDETTPNGPINPVGLLYKRPEFYCPDDSISLYNRFLTHNSNITNLDSKKPASKNTAHTEDDLIANNTTSSFYNKVKIEASKDGHKFEKLSRIDEGDLQENPSGVTRVESNLEELKDSIRKLKKSSIFQSSAKVSRGIKFHSPIKAPKKGLSFCKRAASKKEDAALEDGLPNWAIDGEKLFNANFPLPIKVTKRLERDSANPDKNEDSNLVSVNRSQMSDSSAVDDLKLSNKQTISSQSPNTKGKPTANPRQKVLTKAPSSSNKFKFSKYESLFSGKNWKTRASDLHKSNILRNYKSSGSIVGGSITINNYTSNNFIIQDTGKRDSDREKPKPKRCPYKIYTDNSNAPTHLALEQADCDITAKKSRSVVLPLESDWRDLTSQLFPLHSAEFLNQEDERQQEQEIQIAKRLFSIPEVASKARSLLDCARLRSILQFLSLRDLCRVQNKALLRAKLTSINPRSFISSQTGLFARRIRALEDRFPDILSLPRQKLALGSSVIQEMELLNDEHLEFDPRQLPDPLNLLVYKLYFITIGREELVHDKDNWASTDQKFWRESCEYLNGFRGCLGFKLISDVSKVFLDYSQLLGLHKLTANIENSLYERRFKYPTQVFVSFVLQVSEFYGVTCSRRFNAINAHKFALFAVEYFRKLEQLLDK